MLDPTLNQQMGGKKHKYKKHRSKKPHKKRRNKRTKGGSLLDLIVPAGLLGATMYMKNRKNSKSKSRKAKKSRSRRRR